MLPLQPLYALHSSFQSAMQPELDAKLKAQGALFDPYADPVDVDDSKSAASLADEEKAAAAAAAKSKPAAVADSWEDDEDVADSWEDEADAVDDSKSAAASSASTSSSSSSSGSGAASAKSAEQLALTRARQAAKDAVQLTPVEAEERSRFRPEAHIEADEFPLHRGDDWRALRNNQRYTTYLERFSKTLKGDSRFVPWEVIMHRVGDKKAGGGVEEIGRAHV